MEWALLMVYRDKSVREELLSSLSCKGILLLFCFVVWSLWLKQFQTQGNVSIPFTKYNICRPQTANGVAACSGSARGQAEAQSAMAHAVHMRLMGVAWAQRTHRQKGTCVTLVSPLYELKP